MLNIDNLYASLVNAARLTVTVDLTPAGGALFQPTHFPFTGAAPYVDPTTGKRSLIVEGEASMANRLESAVWDSAACQPVASIDGLPWVRSTVLDHDGSPAGLTSSVLEANRTASPRILLGVDAGGVRFVDRLVKAMHWTKVRPTLPQASLALFAFDPLTILHGCFFATYKTHGFPCTLSLRRAITCSVVATGAEEVFFGGVKFDHLETSGKDGNSNDGRGNVPYSRSMWTAEKVTLTWTLDMRQIRATGLPETAQRLLVTIAMLKLRRMLRDGLRFRTACDFDAAEPVVIAPAGSTLPTLEALESSVGAEIAACRNAGLFAEPAVTEVTYTTPKASPKKGSADDDGEPGSEDDEGTTDEEDDAPASEEKPVRGAKEKKPRAPRKNGKKGAAS